MADNGDVIIIKPSPMDNFNASKGGTFVPLGPLYLAEVLQKEGYKPYIIDEGNETALERVAKLMSSEVIAIGISTMSGTQLGNAIILTNRLKELYPDIPIIWGGVHVTALPKQTLESEVVDYLVWGEGEKSFIMLLEVLKRENSNALSTIPGIGYRIDGNGHYNITPNAGYTDLNRIYRLPYNLVDMNRYARKLLIGAEKEYPVYTSRGCPFRCTFCSNTSSTWLNTRMRYNSIEHIVEDIRVLVQDYQADMITFADEGFLFNEKRLFNILKALRREGIKIKFRFSSRVDLILRVRKESWKKMIDYGLAAVGAGIESGSENMLKIMSKNITVEQINRMDELLTNLRLFKTYNYMIAGPRETVDDLKDTLRMIAKQARTSVYCPYPFTVYRYIPYPGTEMYEDAIRNGLVEPDNIQGWTNFDTDNFHNSLSRVRPWVQDEYFAFLKKAEPVLEELFSKFTGQNADMTEIERSARKLETITEKS